MLEPGHAFAATPDVTLSLPKAANGVARSIEEALALPAFDGASSGLVVDGEDVRLLFGAEEWKTCSAGSCWQSKLSIDE
jgi:hypothetical protein